MLAHNVADLIQAPFGTTRDVEIDERRADLGPELILTEPIHGRARLHRTQGRILVQCEVQTTAELECSRCLLAFKRELRVHFTEQFQSVDIPGAEDVEDDVETFRIDEHHVMDLTEPMRQYFTIELPLAPLCRPDCPGLCPVCGEPLEGHACTVGESGGSNPFAALADLYGQSNTRDSA